MEEGYKLGQRSPCCTEKRCGEAIFIQFMDPKKQAEELLDKELSVDDEIESSNSEEKRLPKKRTFGVNFSEVGTDDENDSDVIANGNNQKYKKKKPTGAKNADNPQKKTKGKANKRHEELKLFAKHDELTITQILSVDSDPDVELLQKSPSPLKDVTAKTNNHPHFGGKQPKQHKPPNCINVGCAKTKRKLEEELVSARDELKAALDELKTLRMLSDNDEGVAKFGKVPRAVATARNWEEIGNNVWCCPIKVKAAVRGASSRTGLACSMLSIFYPKRELEGKRLHELDQDVVEAIIDFVMVARITEKVRRKKTTENAEQGCTETTTNLSTAPCRSKIKQALRLKCNLIFNKKGKKIEKLDESTAI